MSMNEAQLREALLHVQDKNIFVLAGAGAGKSSLMVKRMIEQAKAGKQAFKHTTAITFTNKAMMELEEKFMEELMLLPDSPEKQSLLDQRNDLTIETIHSFCQKLLQERPIEAGLSPHFSVIEEGEASELFRSVLLDVYYDEFMKVDPGYAYLEENDIQINGYIHMLQAQANYYELGLEEQPLLDVSEEELAANYQSFLHGVEAVLLGHANGIYPGMEYGLTAKFKAKAKAFSLETSLDQLWDDKLSLAENISNLFQAGDSKKIMNLVTDDTMSKADFASFIQAYVWEQFTKKFQAALEDGTLTVEGMLTGKQFSDLEGRAPDWLDQCREILTSDDPTADKLAALFRHCYELPAAETDIRNILTSHSRKKYEYIADSSIEERAVFFLNEASFASGKVKPTFMAALNMLQNEALTYSADGRKLKAIMQAFFKLVIQRYEEAKRHRNVVTNNELLKKTYDLLHKEEVRQYFHDKYRYLYVDECQDTDPLQTKILFYLTSETKPNTIEDAKPVPGSLFLVGDPKQSIYRFRNADLRIYAHVKKIAEDNEDWILAELQWNFRSNQALIDWFNQRFDPYFAEELDEFIQPDYGHMQYPPMKKADEKETPCVYQLPLENEKEHIAKWILNYVAKNPAAKYEDILLITVKNASVKKYADILKQYGIPATLSGKVDAHAYPEINRLIDLVDYLASPDRFKRNKVLAQNFQLPFSLSYAYDQASEEEKEEDRFVKIHFALDRLAYYRKMALTYAPMELLSVLVYEEGFGIFAAEISAGEWRASHSILTTFIELVRNRHPQTIAHLAAILQEQGKKSIEYELQADEEANAVRVMNLHKTKGLQAKIVFLVGEDTEFNWKETNLVTREGWEEEIEFALYEQYTVHPSISFMTKHFLDNLADVERHKEAEKIRKLYVAATRAQDMLVITNDRKGKSNWKDLLDEGLPLLDIPEDNVEKQARNYMVPQAIEADQVGATYWQENEGILSSYRSVSPSDSKYFEREEMIEDTRTVGLIEGKAENAPFKGRIWGDIVHEGMEWLVKNPEGDFNDLSYREIVTKGLSTYDLGDGELAVFGQGPIESPILAERKQAIMDNPRLKESLKSVLTTFKHNTFYQSLLQTHEAYAELPFTAWLQAEDAVLFGLKEAAGASDQAVHMNGIIDLVFQSKADPKQFVIVDYKTNQIAQGESIDHFRTRLKGTYRHQLQTYAKMLTEIFHENAQVETFLYSVTLDEFMEV